MKNEKKGGAKASPKSSTERGQTLTEKDNALAYQISNGRYTTLRKLWGAARKGQIKITIS